MPSETNHSTAEKYCILGAGSSGLATAKNFLQAGIPFDCLEREDDLGGNWYYGKPASSVYASTHLISSKRLTEFTDFPMPEEYPPYPGHKLVWQYFQDYATRFGLREHIQFNTAVKQITPCRERPPRRSEELGWQVELENGETRHYRGVVIANGHNWDPRWPDERKQYGSEFAGERLHSSKYKTADAMRGKRVLVVGGGNSGCDLAVEAAIHADRALLSTRRRYPVLPKFFRGKPIDQCHELLHWLRFPLWARRLAGRAVMHVALGPSTRTGVPRPDHRLFETHPVINSQIHHHVGHGDLQLKPDICHFDGRNVEFSDGTTEEIDLIIYATGFRVSFPFIDEQHLNWKDGAPDFFLNIFHPLRDDLFCIGLIQPDSGQWGLVDYQSQLVARFLRAKRQDSAGYAQFQELKQAAQPLAHGVKFKDSPRHRLEVEHYGYRRRLQRLIKELDR